MKIETVSGTMFDIMNPDPKEVKLDDIAWATSRIARFAGHTIPVIPYSVAQHAVQVSKELGKLFDPDQKFDYEYYGQSILNDRNQFLASYQEESKSLSMKETCLIVSEEMQMHGLLHDAAEAYIGDIPSPVKHLPGLKKAVEEVEDKILKSIYISFNMKFPTEAEWEFVKFADMVQRTIEAYNFMYSRGKDWKDLPAVSLKKLQAFEGPVPAIQAYDRFIETFNYLASMR